MHLENKRRSSCVRMLAQVRSRIEHFTWANFAFTIAGGGTASMLRAIPYRFKGLTAIGDIVFLFNFVIFCIFHICMVARFVMFPYTFKRSFRHKIEGQFVATYLLTWATIIMDIELYAGGHTGTWRVKLLNVIYWLYLGVCATQGIVQYAYLYLSHKIDFEEFGPGLLLVIFPAMLSGCIASDLIPAQPEDNALPMLIAGSTLQLMGFNVSLLIYGILIAKFLTKGLPNPDVRPAMFIMVGPLAFTGLSMLGLGQVAESVFPKGYIAPRIDAGSTLAVIGFYQALICWATCLWMFLVAAVTVIHGAIWYGMHFKLAWCAVVFPTAGMTILTMRFGEVIDCKQIKWVGTVIAACVSACYICCVIFYIHAVFTKQIMFPGKDEDAHADEDDLALTNPTMPASALSSSASSESDKKVVTFRV